MSNPYRIIALIAKRRSNWGASPNTSPHLPENFRFIGSPIDGIQFENDKIIFIEFKTADSNLSPTQKQIAELIWQRKVEFREYRIG